MTTDAESTELKMAKSDCDYFEKLVEVLICRREFDRCKEKLIASLTHNKEMSNMSKVTTAQRHLVELSAKAMHLDNLTKAHK